MRAAQFLHHPAPAAVPSTQAGQPQFGQTLTSSSRGAAGSAASVATSNSPWRSAHRICTRVGSASIANGVTAAATCAGDGSSGCEPPNAVVSCAAGETVIGLTTTHPPADLHGYAGDAMTGSTLRAPRQP